jgi:hypothetical protein
MADTQPQLQLGPDVWAYHYPPPEPCSACGGSGNIVLLVSARPCAQCRGCSQVWHEPRVEPEPPKLGYWRRGRSFDERGRVVCETLSFEPVEGG